MDKAEEVLSVLRPENEALSLNRLSKEGRFQIIGARLALIKGLDEILRKELGTSEAGKMVKYLNDQLKGLPGP